MRLVLVLLFFSSPALFSASKASKERSFLGLKLPAVANNPRRLICNSYSKCSERNRAEFLEKREMAFLLVELHEMVKYGGYMVNLKRFEKAIERRADLCKDTTTAGLLLKDGAVRDWPMACIWNAAGTNKSEACAPYDFKDKNTFGFIDSHTWKTEVYEFRKKIGCPETDIYMAGRVEENYFCRERCTTLGIGYLGQMLILLSMIFAFFILRRA
ncbi:hypothetical protein L596_025631 [Steinernema carpocapsae]|uniref:Uncharacterized protein n=1 Tax=Steinernema carpocapsae TaxID=34508 RepID=A0A4U5M8C2_STECR|nr:hypothetical protein L596_025631 [Steinernema carpocapsae]